MSKSKFKFRYTFWNGYNAGAVTSYYCKQRGELTYGNERGTGWGPTIAIAKRRAKATRKVDGNRNIEWVLGHIQIFENGKLIHEEY